MAALTPTTVFIPDGQSACAYGLETYGPGTYKRKYAFNGDGMYSTVFIKSITPGATLDVNYYETTTGEGLGERIDLAAHIQITDAIVPPFSHSVCIPKLHRAIQAEAIVSGGDIEFSVYSSSKQISMADKFLLEDGAIPVTFQGTQWDTILSAASVAGTKVKLGEFTIPALTTRNITRMYGTACNEGVFTLEIAGAPNQIIAIFATNPSDKTFPFKFEPGKPISSGVTLEAYYEAELDNAVSTAFLHVMATDIT